MLRDSLSGEWAPPAGSTDCAAVVDADGSYLGKVDKPALLEALAVELERMPFDERLQWMLGELLNASGDVIGAATASHP